MIVCVCCCCFVVCFLFSNGALKHGVGVTGTARLPHARRVSNKKKTKHVNVHGSQHLLRISRL